MSASGTFRIRSTGYACPASGYTNRVCTNRSSGRSLRRSAAAASSTSSTTRSTRRSTRALIPRPSDRTGRRDGVPHLLARRTPAADRNAQLLLPDLLRQRRHDQRSPPHRGPARDLRLADVRPQLPGRDRGRRAIAGLLQPGQLRVFEQPDLQGHLHRRREQHRAAADERPAQADRDLVLPVERSDAHHAQRLEHDCHQRRQDDDPSIPQ